MPLVDEVAESVFVRPRPCPPLCMLDELWLRWNIGWWPLLPYGVLWSREFNDCLVMFFRFVPVSAADILLTFRRTFEIYLPI